MRPVSDLDWSYACGSRSAHRPINQMNSSAANKLFSEVSRTQAVQRDSQERRRNRRAPLSWLIYLKGESFAQPILTRTKDISSEGFYCFLKQPVRPGEHIDCDIVVPTHSTRDSSDAVYLSCRARAIRVEEVAGGQEFGVACRIEEYRVISTEGPSILP